jgi:hypothetical protein
MMRWVNDLKLSGKNVRGDTKSMLKIESDIITIIALRKFS